MMMPDDQGQPKVEAAPYTALALIYDQVMSHVDYALWARHVDRLVQIHRPETRQIIDLSCGTGTCCAHLSNFGYQVLGMDASSAMIRQARQKYRRTRLQGAFVCGNIMFPPFRNMQVCISLYDSMNYLMTAEQWKTCLKNVYDSLEKNGLFLFDISTLYNSKRFFSNFEENRLLKGGAYRRISRFSEKDGMQMNDFEIRLDGKPAIVVERHRQVIRPISQIKEMISKTDFELVGIYRGFTIEKASERCERVHFVLRRRR